MSDRGTSHFIWQRRTAMANALLALFLVWFLVAHYGDTRAGVVVALKNPLIALAMALTLISMCWHMQLGLQVVIEDYVHTASRRSALLFLNKGFALLVVATGLYPLAKIFFGS